MADLLELQRITQRDVGTRELKDLAAALALILETLEPDERVLGAATGDSVRGNRCLAVATSRKLAVADETHLDQVAYPRMTEVEYSEGWRKGNLVVRAQGTVADIRGVHLDRARRLRALIQTARTNTVLR